MMDGVNSGVLAVAADESVEHVVENNGIVTVATPLLSLAFTISRITAVESEALTMSWEENTKLPTRQSGISLRSTSFLASPMSPLISGSLYAHHNFWCSQ